MGSGSNIHPGTSLASYLHWHHGDYEVDGSGLPRLQGRFGRLLLDSYCLAGRKAVTSTIRMLSLFNMERGVIVGDVPRALSAVCCLFLGKGGTIFCEVTGRRRFSVDLPQGGLEVPSLASQTHFRKRGKGLVNCVYKPCPGALYSAPQSRCSILSHDTLHHCFSSNSSLENSEGELGHLSRYYRNCKNTSRIVFRKRAYPATGNSRVHYLKSGYVIQLIAFRWDKAAVHQTLPSLAEVGLACETKKYRVP